MTDRKHRYLLVAYELAIGTGAIVAGISKLWPVLPSVILTASCVVMAVLTWPKQ